MPMPPSTAPIPRATPARSLGDSHRTIRVPQGAGFWRRFLAFAGPG